MNTMPRSGLRVIYPSSDGERMAENTKQYEWIVMIKGGIELVFKDNPQVFVAGDNLIYPVEGDPKIRVAPDVYVAFGRPKGHRSAYLVWEEGNIFPQVVVEVLSPGNRASEMTRKRDFYEKYGAEEYYIVDPDDHTLEIWLRQGDKLEAVPFRGQFTSPRLGVRFEIVGQELVLKKPTGERFQMFLELGIQAEQSQANKDRADRLEAINAELLAELAQLRTAMNLQKSSDSSS